MSASTIFLGSFLLLFGACNKQPAANKPVPAEPTAASAAQTNAEPRYAGTYSVTAPPDCALSITVTRQADGYRFRTGQQQGPVTITREGGDTYFTFVGLKGKEPVGDITAAWADTALVIQNAGNSMNPYLRFADCGAKYLTLRRQQL